MVAVKKTKEVLIGLQDASGAKLKEALRQCIPRTNSEAPRRNSPASIITPCEGVDAGGVHAAREHCLAAMATNCANCMPKEEATKFANIKADVSEEESIRYSAAGKEAAAKRVFGCAQAASSVEEVLGGCFPKKGAAPAAADSAP